MTAGTAAKSFRTYGWHTYNWTTYYQPVDANLLGGIWTSFAVSVDADPTAIASTGQAKYAGTVTIEWGTRPGAYSGRSAPIPVAANTAFNYRITGLRRKTQYFCNAIANVQGTPTGGVPQSQAQQYGEVSYTTT
jgi:hypothetical protein